MSIKRVFCVGAALAVLGAGAQTLPAPPASPAPVTNYKYDANGKVSNEVSVSEHLLG
ncbi:hypothetical protein [Piscinibacter sp.]|uniref:hypothetical protein n=1 Tax=Piscinibacter sp. TaxID=1903157 RepID=UPI0039E43D67